MAKDDLDWRADPFHTRFEARTDGSVLLQPQGALPEYPVRLMDWLEHWAGVAPERTLVARRAHGGDWKSLSYCEVLDRVRRVAAGLMERNLSEQLVAALYGSACPADAIPRTNGRNDGRRYSACWVSSPRTADGIDLRCVHREPLLHSRSV
jgi:hypothetical protein